MSVGLNEAGARVGVLACELRFREQTPGYRKPLPYAGTFVLCNASDEEVVIAYTMSPVQYLRVTVTTPAGGESCRDYEGMYAPPPPGAVLRLAPGQRYPWPVSLFGDLGCAEIAPGRYVATAVFDTGSLRAESEPFAFEVA